MDGLKTMINAVICILQINISVGNYSFSLFSVLLFSMVGTLIFKFIFEFFKTE